MKGMTHTDSEDIEVPINILEQQEESRQSPVDASPHVGFLPIETNWFDRIFISVVIWVAVSLFWFRFVEPLGPSIWISNVIMLVLAIIIVRKG